MFVVPKSVALNLVMLRFDNGCYLWPHVLLHVKNRTIQSTSRSRVSTWSQLVLKIVSEPSTVEQQDRDLDEYVHAIPT